MNKVMKKGKNYSRKAANSPAGEVIGKVSLRVVALPSNWERNSANAVRGKKGGKDYSSTLGGEIRGRYLQLGRNLTRIPGEKLL